MIFKIANSIYKTEEKNRKYFPSWINNFEINDESGNSKYLDFVLNESIFKDDLMKEYEVSSNEIRGYELKKYVYYYRRNANTDYFDAKIEFDSHSIIINITYDFSIKLIQNPRWMLRLLSLDYLLWQNNGLILHSSQISYGGKSIVFFAPSGTGKSTQARLWNEFRKAKIINGDRTAITYNAGEFISHGLPISGSSDIWVNESNPIQALVLLEQSKENELIRMNPVDAFRSLWPEVNFVREDERFAEFITEFLIELIINVPIYKLKNRADKDCVDLTFSELFGNSTDNN